MSKKVSVIIPYVKDRGYLNEAIESVNNQTYKNIELVLEKSDNSQGVNINNGFKKCNGDFICVLHDDDILPLDSIEKRVVSMGNYDFIHGKGVQFKSDNGKTVLTYTPDMAKPTLQDMVIKNRIHGGTTMYSRKVLETVSYDESLITGEEYDFHLNLINLGFNLGYVDYVVYKYRLHNNQKSRGVGSIDKKVRLDIINKIKNKYNV